MEVVLPLSRMVFVSNSFRKNSFNEFIDAFAATTIVESLAGARQVALLGQLPRHLIHVFLINININETIVQRPSSIHCNVFWMGEFCKQN